MALWTSTGDKSVFLRLGPSVLWQVVIDGLTEKYKVLFTVDLTSDLELLVCSKDLIYQECAHWFILSERTGLDRAVVAVAFPLS